MRVNLGETNYQCAIENHRRESSEKVLKEFIEKIIDKEYLL